MDLMIIDLEDRRERCADEVPEYPEMLLKEFLLNESERTGLGTTSIYKRIKGGYYPDLTVRRESARRVYVINTKYKQE
jgi:hypothetical protein